LKHFFSSPPGCVSTTSFAFSTAALGLLDAISCKTTRQPLFYSEKSGRQTER
jgi:hypothetical protein